MTPPATHGAAPLDTSGRRRLVLRALWNLRLLGLFVLGPVVGVLLGAVIFGMPRDLRWVAVGMFLFSLALFGVLVRGEIKGLSRRP